jgi:hypothetical protein
VRVGRCFLFFRPGVAFVRCLSSKSCMVTVRRASLLETIDNAMEIQVNAFTSATRNHGNACGEEKRSHQVSAACST